MDKKSRDELLERLATSGTTIEEGPVRRWGARGIGSSVYFRDPEDNLIEARTYENVDVHGD